MDMPPLFSDRQFYRNLFTLAIPIMLQNLANSLVNMLTTIMIGRLGTVEVAAVALGNQVFFLYDLIVYGICSGGAIFTAQFWGKRDIAGIRKNLGFCMTLNLSSAVVFFLLSVSIPRQIISIYSRDQAVIAAGADYLRTLSATFIPFAVSIVFMLTLRSVEKVRVALAVTAVYLILNSILNFLFIFGAGPIPAMGVKGAALATVISRTFQAVALVAVTYLKKYVAAGTFKELFSFNIPYAAKFFRFTLPVIINEGIWALGITIQNIIMARTSTDAIAAYNILGTMSMLTWVIFLGLGNAAGVLIGKKIGERDEKTARDYASKLVRFTPSLALIASFVQFLISLLLPRIFNVNQETIRTASQMFIIYCCAYPIRAFNNNMAIGVCRAGGDTVFCAFYDVSMMWIVAVPLTFLAAFVFHAPVWVIFLCTVTDQPLKALLGIWRFKSGKWLHHVTDKI